MQENFLTKQQIQGILDSTPKDIPTQEIIQGLVNRGFTLEGLNDTKKDEPNLLQTLAGGVIQAPMDLISTGMAGVGALGEFAGKKLAGQDITMTEAYKNQTGQVQESGAKGISETLTGQNVQPAQSMEQLGGQVLQTGGTLAPGSTIPRLAASGAAVLGGEAMRRDASLGEVAQQAALGAGIGGALGAIAPAVSIIKDYSKIATPAIREGMQAIKPSASGIMQRVARIPKGKQTEFETKFGESVGGYLENRGLIGTEDEVVTKVGDWFLASRNAADAGFAQLPGRFQPEPVKDALSSLRERLLTTSTKASPDKDLARVDALLKKFDNVGLDMTEINEAKRLFERRVKLGYSKAINPKEVELATSIDSNIRNWQRTQAERLGFKNLAEINAETQKAKYLLDSLEREIAGKAGNNAVTLTDWIILAEGGPANMAAFLVKKGLSSDYVQSAVAKMFAKTPTKKLPVADVGQAQFDATVNSYWDFLKKTGSIPEGLKKPQSLLKGQKVSQLSLQDTIPQSTKGASKGVEKSIPEEYGIDKNAYEKATPKEANQMKIEAQFGNLTKNIPKELQPLYNEAKKYKSAEEFVDAVRKFNFKEILGEDAFNKALAKINADMPEPTAAGTKQYVIDLWYKANNKVKPKPKVAKPKILAPGEFNPEDIPF